MITIRYATGMQSAQDVAWRGMTESESDPERSLRAPMVLQVLWGRKGAADGAVRDGVGCCLRIGKPAHPATW